MSTQANILIVDDTPANLHLLVGLLKDQGYKVRPAPSGKHALAVARSETLDLVLLDIMMPGMDGYEVCRRLKSDEATRDIPIIFLSALKDTFDKVRAFEAGGVDYINKPFQAEEVLARVRTQIQGYQMQQQLQLRNAQLQEHQAQLELEIVERQRVEGSLREANAVKDTFFSIIAHDLRSPFTALLGYADHALKSFDSLSQEELKSHIVEMRTSAKSVFTLLENLLTWSRIQRGVMDYQPCSLLLKPTLFEICRLFLPQAESKQISLCQKVSGTLSVHADANMLCTVIRNLLSNALKFTQAGGRIELSAHAYDRVVEISISDTGIGIPEGKLPDLFRLDVKTTSSGTDGEQGTGLGLPLCKDLIELNEGTIRVKSFPGRGTTFIVTLPGALRDFENTQARAKIRAACSLSEGSEVFEPLQVSDSPSPSLDTLAASLAGLSKSRQAELHHAAMLADIHELERINKQIAQEDEQLVAVLDKLLFQYDFKTLLEAFEEIGAEIDD